MNPDHIILIGKWLDACCALESLDLNVADDIVDTHHCRFDYYPDLDDLGWGAHLITNIGKEAPGIWFVMNTGPDSVISYLIYWDEDKHMVYATASESDTVYHHAW